MKSHSSGVFDALKLYRYSDMHICVCSHIHVLCSWHVAAHVVTVPAKPDDRWLMRSFMANDRKHAIVYQRLGNAIYTTTHTCKFMRIWGSIRTLHGEVVVIAFIQHDEIWRRARVK